MIAIKGMEMPKICKGCAFYYLDTRDNPWCGIRDRDLNEWYIFHQKPDWCPLVELPDTPRNPEDAYREDFGKEI